MIGSCPPPLRSSLLAASLAVAILAMGTSHASAAEYGYEASGNDGRETCAVSALASAGIAAWSAGI